MQNRYTFHEVRAYRKAFNPMTEQKPFIPSGPPERVWSSSLTVGQYASLLPSQVAMTSTNLTPYPHHWGRNYWFAPHSEGITSSGHIPATSVDGLAQQVHNMYETWANAQFIPVVPITQYSLGGKPAQIVPFRGLLQVTGVQVDDVFDIQRRRRASTTTYRKILPVPTGTNMLPGLSG
jgi:hypothetical protein